MKKLSKISVEKLRLRAYIGFKKWETEKLQDIVISYSFKYDANKAIAKDSDKLAIDYKKITKTIIKQIENNRFYLLETLAESVWSIIKSNVNIVDAYVKVEKPNALRFCDNVYAEISDNDRYNYAVISLGSNINPDNNIQAAINKLNQIGTILKTTEIITTKPLKFKDQDDFRNGAVLLETKLYYSDLRHLLKTIETQLKRVRTENKNAPRTIDLDIVVYNNTITDNEINEFSFLKDFVNELLPDLKVE